MASCDPVCVSADTHTGVTTEVLAKLSGIWRNLLLKALSDRHIVYTVYRALQTKQFVKHCTYVCISYE
jgi:hypothetical protein